jgi:predicted phage terminase large subunit-like protein
MAKDHLIHYIKYMRPSLLPDFEHEPAKHHYLIAEVLESLASRECNRAAISLPPGSAKSKYSSIWWPTWLLANNPKLKIICVSNSEGLAEDFSAERRRIFNSKEWQVLAGTSLMPDSKSLHKQFFPEGGGIYAVGAGTTITGKRADYLIADDLITGQEQAGSLGQLDKLWNWYLSDARSRIKPDPKTHEEGVELMIATRWHVRDPIGRVMRLSEDGHEHWQYVKIPMECNSQSDPIGRELGERLWPEYFTPRMVKDAKRTPIMWNTLYQQEPAVSENAWVAPSHIHVQPASAFPTLLKFYIGCDLAQSLDKGDFTVFVVIGMDADKNFYVVDLWRKQADPDTSAKKLVALCAHYSPVGCWVENDNSSKIHARVIELESVAQGVAVPLRMSKMKNRDKETRAVPLRALFMQDRITLAEAPWNTALRREVAGFLAGGRNDDIIDAMGVVAKELYRLGAPRHPVQKKKPEPIQGNMQIKDGKIVTRQNVKQLFPLNAARRRSMRI